MPEQLILDDRERMALRLLMADAIADTGSNEKAQIYERILGKLAASTSSPVRQFLDLSTAHLTAEDREFLARSADPVRRDGVAVLAGTYGWFVYAHDERCCEGISDVLWATFEKARGLGCDYVMFDADAAPVDDLPVFDDAALPEPS